MNQNKQEQWEVDLLKLDEKHGIIDVGGGDELEKKTKILKKFISNLISKTRQEAVEERDKLWIKSIEKYESQEGGNKYVWEEYIDEVKALSLKKEQE